MSDRRDSAQHRLQYKGDVSPTEAWEMLASEQESWLLDCRTPAEWAFVGKPDLEQVGKQCLMIPWQMYPHMQENPDFVQHIAQSGVSKDAAILCLCRSGGRSRMAAMALTEAGFQRCYNVDQGFEGGLDESGHRGTLGGWKAAGLPWRQE